MRTFGQGDLSQDITLVIILLVIIIYPFPKEMHLLSLTKDILLGSIIYLNFVGSTRSVFCHKYLCYIFVQGAVFYSSGQGNASGIQCLIKSHTSSGVHESSPTSPVSLLVAVIPSIL